MNELTKKIYNLLYNDYKEICKSIKSKKKIVICCQNEDDTTEVFKAVFWCGQYPDADLNIVIYTKDPEDYIKGLKTKMPGWKPFISFNNEENAENHLATVSVIDNVDDFLNDEGNYVIDDEKLKQVSVVNVELMRLAENINFAYALQDNERANFEKVNDAFWEKDEKGNYRKAYDIQSSYASAVHIPYKLKYCENEYDKINGEEMRLTSEAKLVKVINAGKDKLRTNEKLAEIYNELVVLEHHRWMVYTVSEGWKQPTKKQIYDYVYIGDDKQKFVIGEERYHACLYDCGDKIADLTNEFNKIYRGQEYTEKEGKLDDISLYCYKILCERTKDIRIDMFSNVMLISENLYYAIKQMVDNVDNSLSVYKREVEKIRKDHFEMYKKLQDDLRLVEIRNQKRNFFAIDAQLIAFIPFCLWYRKKYSNIITLSAENVFDDIAIPLLLCPQKAFFIVKKTQNYKSKINNFFKTYYDSYIKNKEEKINVNVKCIDPQELKNISPEENQILLYQKAIDKAITKVKKNNTTIDNDIVINIVPHSNPAAIMAVGKYYDNYPIVSYCRAGIKCYNNKMNEYYNIGDRNLTVSEGMILCDWIVDDQGREVMPYNQCVKLSNIFWETSERKKTENKIPYTIWQKLFEYYKENYGDKISIDWNELSGIDRIVQGYIDKNMPVLLQILEQTGIIEKLNINNNNANFEIKDKETFAILTEKSGTLFENIVYYKCKYSGMFNDVKTGVKIEEKSDAPNDIRTRETKKKEVSDNEIDIIATKGLLPLFISCKTSAQLNKEYIYEISSEAKLFGGIPVIAVAQTLKYDIPFVRRAKSWGVSLLDAKIIKNDDYFRDAIKRILNGNIVSPLDLQYNNI